MATETKQKGDSEKLMAKALAERLGGEMVEVKVTLFSPFTDFLKEYLSFFGKKKTVEQFCMELIYEKCEFLHNELSNFVSNRSHLLEHDSWYFKHHHIAACAFGEQAEDEAEDKDC